MRFSVRPVEPVADAPLLHRWVTHPKAAFWQMQDADVARVEREYQEIAASPSHDAFIGLHAGRPAFLFERYDPAHDPVGRAYPVRVGDVGMHFLVAPTDRPVHGFTRAVIAEVMEVLFADPATRRVVVEPDVRNEAVHALNATVGFRVVGEVELPNKRALLSICTRGAYEAAVR
jgi:RimJ/RimL family protein N-acetyltransferase